MEFNPNYSDLVTKTLTDFLTLKFTFQGEDLIRAIEDFQWSSIESIKPEIFISVIEEHHSKNIPKSGNTQAVSVALPLDKNGNPVVSLKWLKGSACFPWELDPVKDRLLLKISNQKHILIQLAQASHYGSPRASEFIRDIARQYFNLREKHPFKRDRNFSDYKIYRFPIGPIDAKEDLKAEFVELCDMDKEEFSDLFDKLFLLEKEGIFKYEEELKKEELEDKISEMKQAIQTSQNSQKIYKIFVCGKSYKDEALLNLIQRNLIAPHNSKGNTCVLGFYKLEKTVFELEVRIAEKFPQNLDHQDGIIIAEFQTDPEAVADELKEILKAKSFLFFGTAQPNPSRAKSTNWYLRQEDAVSEYGDKLLENFFHDMIE